MFTRPMKRWPRALGRQQGRTDHAAVSATRAAWTRALLPSLVLTVAISLDQMTRGPSITAMILTQLLG
jgi:hypothetical protein